MIDTIETNPYAEHAALGAAVMDGRDPNWVDKIDLSRLKMDDCTDCIIGQAIGDYASHNNDLLRTPGMLYRDHWDALAEHGFTLSQAECFDKKKWSLLEEAWRTEVEKRRV